MGALVPVVVVLWASFAFFGLLYFFLDRDAVRKRRLWWKFCVGFTALFLALFLLAGEITLFLFAAPPATLIALGNIYAVRFCDSCGATAVSYWIIPKQTCPRCGHALS
jgi:hypothetical protein